MSETSRYDMKGAAKLIAMFVRDGIEDFHCKHLTDEQMRILNPLIRNAIYTALYAMEHAEEDWRCDRLLEEKRRAIPAYWEQPVGVAHSDKPTGTRCGGNPILQTTACREVRVAC